MAQITLDQIQHLPEYIALTRARRKITWSLSALVMLVYFALILLIAFSPMTLGNPIGSGTTSVGIVLGLSVILFCFLVTGFYVYYANHVLEPLANAVKEKAGKE